MIINVSGFKFDIKFVPMIVHDLYSDIMDLTSRLMQIPSEIEDQGILSEDEAKDKTLAEKIRIKHNYSKIVNDLMKEVKENKTAICEKRFKAIQTIIEKNGYEFNRKWWEEDIDIECHNDFLLTCIKKDYEPKAITKEKN